MKIVVLDGYGLNPGDLSWKGMEALGELVVYDRTSPSEVMERSANAQLHADGRGQSLKAVQALSEGLCRKQTEQCVL